MSLERLSAFESMAVGQPENEMVWYGLASEYSKLERWDDAVTAARKVIEINPSYTAAYQLLGSAFSSLGKSEDAVAAWTAGIEVADRNGAWKAREHMERLRAGEGAGSAFCQGE